MNEIEAKRKEIIYEVTLIAFFSWLNGFVLAYLHWGLNIPW